MITEALIVDSFAGGGGASTGIEMALGRSPDIAINHDPDALALHQANHPDTLHVSENVYKVDPLDYVRGRHVGLAWFSPDCKHFSKAKGGTPVQRNIRDLAWIIPGWVERIQKSGGKVDVVILENVEEFRTWGPLVEGPKGLMPDPGRRGETFGKWCRALKRLGGKVEWRELRACDYGAPTIRKRLFVIVRFDGKPIVWPERTHGDPRKPEDARLIAQGKLKPWRTAAEIIDWSLPCPSIFDTSEEIMQKFGVRAIRPLAEATMRRIARGVVRYVLEAEKPFVVPVAHAGDSRVHSVDEPVRTQTSHSRSDHAVVVPSFVGCGGRAGQSAPRGGDEPTGTMTAKADGCVVAAHLTKFQSNSTGSALDEPVPTITANSYHKRPGGAAPIGVVAAFMAQHTAGTHPGRPARGLDEPISTLSATGAQQSVVAAHLQNMRGSDRRDAPVNGPVPTLSAQGNHAALIAPFLMKYYGTGGQWAAADSPMHTDTARDRMGLVTVDIDGQTYAIADIGMRMLTPRERFRAQGFPDSYIIDRRPDGSPISATVQGSCCGNSVCPPVAAALVAANCGHLAEIREAAE